MKITQVGTMTEERLPRPERPVFLVLEPEAVTATQQILRFTSAGVREALVLWAGRALDNGHASISHIIEPNCVATKEVLVVPNDERLDVANFLRHEELLVFADLHTHPGPAYLSTADRARPFSIRSGFYALVVPDYGLKNPFEDWRIYEAVDCDWEEVGLEDRVCTRRVCPD